MMIQSESETLDRCTDALSVVKQQASSSKRPAFSVQMSRRPKVPDSQLASTSVVRLSGQACSLYVV